MKVRAMFYVKEIKHHAVSDPGAVHAEVKLSAAFGSYLKGLAEGNKDWSKFTPSGELAMTITNPTAIDQFEIGEVYELSIEKAAKVA